MSTEEKHGSNGHNGNGHSTTARPRRRSSLMQAAVALPTVESSLEDFIARANATLVDVDAWESEARAEKERQARESADAEQAKLREVETSLRADAARERGLLERRIETLQQELAEAQARRAELEARVAVLGSQQALSATVDELEAKLAAAENRAPRRRGRGSRPRRRPRSRWPRRASRS